MKFVKTCAARSAIAAALMVIILSAGCSKTPTAPDPPPPPPPPPPVVVVVANPPSLSCSPDGISRSTVNAAGLALTFDTPAVSDGEGSVSVTCNPGSGHTFPIGTTAVTCTATDTLNRSATCSFNVTVSKLPTLSRTKFLAFGDSVTSGEVTAPVGSLLTGFGTSTRQIVIPSVSYPTVFGRTLTGRYASQAAAISVANYGLSGEKAINARNRFISALNVVAPEVVLLMHGHNDIQGGVDGAASGAASEIRIMINEAQRRGARVFLATICPPRRGGFHAIDQIYVDDYNGRMRDAAIRQGATLVDIYGALLPDVTRYIGIDGLHPTEAGYAKIADTFFQAIQAAFEVR